MNTLNYKKNNAFHSESIHSLEYLYYNAEYNNLY